ncbi:MAG: hypothetical protein EBS09_08490 [Flavobacteriia bacterium]|nr:hypothetical protein [Flavobacteriia bacterium]
MKGLFFGCLLLLFCYSNWSQSYKSTHSEGFSQAKAFYLKHKKQFSEIAANHHLSPKFVFCIVSPELANFSEMRNFMELNAIKLVYLQLGSDYGDFSVGQFQMKPSFVERLETEVKKHSKLKRSYAAYLYEHNNRNARSKRLESLESVQGQFHYLDMFCAVLAKREIDFANEEEKLKFYATAYNTGFYKSEEVIRSEFGKLRFPAVSKKKYNYAQIALEFFEAIK